MARKYLKFLAILIMLTLISCVIFFYLSGSSNLPLQEKKNYPSLKKKKDLTIRGFRFSGYHEGQKAITIKAAKFSVEKKKIGIFKLSLARAARFRGAEIDFYVNNDPSAADLQDKKTIALDGIFSKETFPVSVLNGATSAVFEPVKINFCLLDDTPVTEIRAKRATFEPLHRRIVLRGEIFATAGFSQLSTNRLMIYPEKGIIEINNKFVLKTQNEQIIGEKLTTDLFLKKVGRQ
jgi:hypothetical protein